MILKVTIAQEEGAKLKLVSHADREALNPKELLLCSAAMCAAMTLQYLLKKERLEAKEFEISVSGELSTSELRAESVFTSFDVAYRLACRTPEEEEPLARMVRIVHTEWCGLVKMLKRIAPVTHSIAVVCTA